MFLLTFASLAILFLYLRYLLFRLTEPYDPSYRKNSQ
jgi:hypothetical protein